MLKRRLSVFILAILAGNAANAAPGLFGTDIPNFCSLSTCSNECGDSGCSVDPDCCEEPGCADLSGCGEDCCGLFGGSGTGLASHLKLRKSDHCFDDFISPMTNPVYFEDPRTLTEARLIYMNHRVPAVLGGGSVQLFAMQLRAALTDDLSIIATKDGYAVSDSPLVDDGWANVSAGLKLNVYKNVCTQTIASVGTTYEIPMGSRGTLQGHGDGEFHFFGTGGTEILEDTHFISGTGLRLPVDQDAQSTVFYWSNHIDRKIGKSGFYFLG